MSKIVKGSGALPNRGSETRRLIKHQVASSHEEAERIRERAEANAAQLLSEARERAALLESEARARGYEDGNREWTERMLELSEARDRLIERNRAQLIELSIKLAEKILGTELATRPEAMSDLVLNALRGHPVQEKISIRVRPADLEILRAQRPRLAEAIAAHGEIDLLEDETIEGGGCVIETPIGIVDARLETQLGVLERLLLDDSRPSGQRVHRRTGGASSPDDSLLDSSALAQALEQSSPVEVRGRVTGLTGIVVKAMLPETWAGELCYIRNPHGEHLVRAEVVGFDRNEALLMPLGELSQIGMASEVIPTGRGLTVRVGSALLGRVLNGLGEPRDTAERGRLEADLEYPVMAPPPDPLSRGRITRPMPIGIKAVDGLLTVGEGQRVGLFAGAGGGKSVFLGMVARNTAADVNVIALIGERGREVNEFIEECLGPEGMQRSVVVVATSDEPSLVRLKAAYVAQAIADYFRDQGMRVMLLMDSVTRFARAQREVGLAAGEPPARAGFTPSVFSELPRLLERSGNSDRGSITAFYAVLVEGDDLTEPVADEVRAILDGHIVLSRALAASGHYPAIDVLGSISRVFPSITDAEHQRGAERVRSLLATHTSNREAITYNIYKRGSDPKIDEAIAKIGAIQTFLRQGTHENISYDDCRAMLARI